MAARSGPYPAQRPDAVAGPAVHAPFEDDDCAFARGWEGALLLGEPPYRPRSWRDEVADALEVVGGKLVELFWNAADAVRGRS